jgi:hypothetical protein
MLAAGGAYHAALAVFALGTVIYCYPRLISVRAP